MTDDLTTALRDLAESDPPRPMDVEKVLREGRHGRVRRRMATLGGGTTVLAVTALAVGVLAPAGSAGHRGGTGAAGTAAGAVAHRYPPFNDRVLAHWQFGYLPKGMAVDGGSYGWGEGGTTSAYDGSGFVLTLVADLPDSPPPPNAMTDATARVMKTTPATVPGAVEAFWLDSAGRFGGGGDSAVLSWKLPGGHLMQMTANHIHSRADWKEQTLKAAAGVVRQDRPVPMPTRIAGVPQGFQLVQGFVSRSSTGLVSNLTFSVGSSSVYVETSTIGSEARESSSSACTDSNGLRVCVGSPDPEPAALKAIGGAKGLLDRVTSLGPDPANWATDVIH